MARFRLKAKHYINVPGTEWEQKEVDQTSGKQLRKIYQVPLYLDPDDPSHYNYPGEVIVSTKHDKAYPRDIVFVGPCTVDMEPLDEEAENLRLAIAATGEHPIESLSGTFGEMLTDKFQREADRIALRVNQESDSRIADLEKQLAELKSLIASSTATGPKLSIGAK